LIKDRKKYGHDLLKVLETAQSLGLSKVVKISNREIREIEKANEKYDNLDKGFQYFKIWDAVRAYPDFPDLQVLDECVTKLVEKLRSVCQEAV
jgi:hypothetical protein